jgi:hypothetical protein
MVSSRWIEDRPEDKRNGDAEMSDLLDEITKRWNKAKKGPYSIAGRPPSIVTNPSGPDHEIICVGQDGNIEGQTDNWDTLDFLAHTWSDIPFLLGYIQGQRMEISRLKKELEPTKSALAVVQNGKWTIIA